MVTKDDRRQESGNSSYGYIHIRGWHRNLKSEYRVLDSITGHTLEVW